MRHIETTVTMPIIRHWFSGKRFKLCVSERFVAGRRGVNMVTIGNARNRKRHYELLLYALSNHRHYWLSKWLLNMMMALVAIVCSAHMLHIIFSSLFLLDFVTMLQNQKAYFPMYTIYYAQFNTINIFDIFGQVHAYLSFHFNLTFQFRRIVFSPRWWWWWRRIMLVVVQVYFGFRI